MEELAAILQQNNVDTSTLALLSNFNGETIYYLITPGGQIAVDLWHKLHGLVEQTGCWPVILGEYPTILIDAFADAVPGTLYAPDTAAQIIEYSQKIDVDQWFRERLAKVYGSELANTINELVHGGSPENVVTNSDDYFGLPYDSPNKPLEKCFIAFVPTKICWEVPAYLKFGGNNNCPLPIEQVVVLKHWYELYNAEVVGMSDRIIEMTIKRPPVTKQQAIELAEEQFAYDSDVLGDGIETIEELGARLINSPIWSFWWD